MGLARFAAREAIHAARRASYQQQRQQQRRPVYYRPPVRRPAAEGKRIPGVHRHRDDLLVAAVAWGVIADIAVLALHRSTSPSQTDMSPAWPLPPPSAVPSGTRQSKSG